MNATATNEQGLKDVIMSSDKAEFSLRLPQSTSLAAFLTSVYFNVIEFHQAAEKTHQVKSTSKIILQSKSKTIVRAQDERNVSPSE